MTKRFDIMSACVKCGATKARARFEPNQHFLSRDTFDLLTPEEQEEFHNLQPYMERTCLTCEYSWKELPLDAEGDTND